MKKTLLRLLATTAIVAPIAATISCGGEKSDVGATVYSASDPFMASVTGPFKDKLKELGISFSLSDSQGDMSKQIDQINASIAGGAKVLAINMVDLKAGKKVITLAKEAKIPLILYNREAKPEEMRTYNKAYYLGPLGADSGKAQAKAIYNDLVSGDIKDRNADGKIEYKIIGGANGHPDATARTIYVQSELRKLIREKGINDDKFDSLKEEDLKNENNNNKGIIKVDSKFRVYVKKGATKEKVEKILTATVAPTAVQYTQWGASATAESTIRGIIGQQETLDLDIVMANGDPSAIKAGNYALDASAGYKKWDEQYSSSARRDYLPIYGVNGGDDVKSAIKAGKVAGSVLQEGKIQGEGLAIMVKNLLRGEDIKKGLDSKLFDFSDLKKESRAIRPYYYAVNRKDA